MVTWNCKIVVKVLKQSWYCYVYHMLDFKMTFTTQVPFTEKWEEKKFFIHLMNFIVWHRCNSFDPLLGPTKWWWNLFLVIFHRFSRTLHNCKKCYSFLCCAIVCMVCLLIIHLIIGFIFTVIGMMDSYNKPVASVWSVISALHDLMNLCLAGTVNTFTSITLK